MDIAHFVCSSPEVLTHLAGLATHFSRHFPWHLLSYDDFLQEGWVGILSVPPDAATVALCLTAARRQMIDAARRFRPGNRGFRQLERLADDDEIEHLQAPTSQNEAQHDLFAVFQRVTPRKQKLLSGLLQQHSLKQIGRQLGVTEGRTCQMKQEVFRMMQKQYQRETHFQEAA